MKIPHYTKVVTCLLIMAVLPGGLSAQATPTGEAPPAAPVLKPTLVENVVYGHAGGVDLKLDMTKPVPGKEPTPVMVYFHGGGWQAGSKRDGRSWCGFFANRGWLGVTVGYRFMPEFPWPAQIEDAKAAIRYLRAHAAELNIDPNRIIAMGDSAGAYLALMLGVTGPSEGLEGDGGNAGFSSQVQAVVSFYSATDFTNQQEIRAVSPEVEAMMQAYYHKTAAEVFAAMRPVKDLRDPIYTRMSVLTHVSKDDPPIMIFQGDADPILPTEHAYKLDRALTAAGVPHELVIVEKGGHGFTRAQYEVAQQKIAAFLGQHLGTKL